MVELGGGSINYLELFISSLIFINIIGISAMTPFLSPDLFIAVLILTLLLISFVLAYCLGPVGAKKKNTNPFSGILHLIFLGIAAMYLVIVLFVIPISLPAYLRLLVDVMMIFILFFLAFVPVFFFTLLGAYLWKDSKKAIVLFIIALVIILVLFNFRALITNYTVDDEELLALHSVISLMNGTNPYGTSYSNVIYQNPKVGFTVLTDNKIVGFMDYPALFFLALVPFYFLAQPTIVNFINAMLPLQASLFILVLLVSFAFSLKRKELLKPKFTLLAFMIVAMLNISSINTYLMIALLVVGYAMLDSKYVWVVLGLALSMQEELWLPVLFLIAYSFNNRGIRRGAINAVGAAAVFLAVNAYFIIQSPKSFFGSVFTTLGGFFLPNGTSSIGFALVKAFPLLLSTYAQMFEVTAVFLVFLLWYWNRKELIPLFSMVPFLITDHAISSYYSTFLFLLIFAVCTSRKKETGWIEKILRKNNISAYAAVAAFALLMMALVCSSHAAYVKNFNISTGNAELTLDYANATSVYRTMINYHGLSNDTIYVYAIGLQSDSSSPFIEGFMNESIIPGAAPKCGGYDCEVNINEIALPRNGSSYELTARIRWLNASVPVEYVAVELYNGDYFYSGADARNASA